jgi:hypothetical protein
MAGLDPAISLSEALCPPTRNHLDKPCDDSELFGPLEKQNGAGILPRRFV